MVWVRMNNPTINYFHCGQEIKSDSVNNKSDFWLRLNILTASTNIGIANTRQADCYIRETQVANWLI